MYKLYPQALLDMEMIWRDGYVQWGEAQADPYIDELVHVFEGLCVTPTLYRERAEFNPPVRFCNFKSPIIVYVAERGAVHVVRVLHKKMDVGSILN